MDHPKATAAILRDFPRIYFACHRRHVIDPATRELVTDKQAEILDHLDPALPVSLSTLAAHMGVTPGTMSVGVERLVRRGYVKRAPDPADKRGVLLLLTRKGERVCRARSVLDPLAIDHLLNVLTPPERKSAIDGLALLARAARKLAADRQALRRQER